MTSTDRGPTPGPGQQRVLLCFRRAGRRGGGCAERCGYPCPGNRRKTATLHAISTTIRALQCAPPVLNPACGWLASCDTEVSDRRRMRSERGHSRVVGRWRVACGQGWRCASSGAASPRTRTSIHVVGTPCNATGREVECALLADRAVRTGSCWEDRRKDDSQRRTSGSGPWMCLLPTHPPRRTSSLTAASTEEFRGGDSMTGGRLCCRVALAATRVEEPSALGHFVNVAGGWKRQIGGRLHTTKGAGGERRIRRGPTTDSTDGGGRPPRAEETL